MKRTLKTSRTREIGLLVVDCEGNVTEETTTKLETSWPADVAMQLQTSVTKVATLPKVPYKMTEAKKRERRLARDTYESR